MKRIMFFMLSTIFMLSSCLSDDEHGKSQQLANQIITRDEAIELATKSYLKFFDQDSRSVSSLKVNQNAVYCYGGKKSRSDVSDTLYYVVNFEDDLGFALISAQPIAEPVIGVSDKGSFNPDEVCENENFQVLINSIPNYIEQQSKNVTSEGVSSAFLDSYTLPLPPTPTVPGTVLAKIDVQWGQRGVYGDSCSNHISGCVATAGAMVMSYYRKPTSMPLTINNQNSTLLLDWTEICKHKRSYTGCQENEVDITHPQISRLLAQIGHSIGANYESSTVTTAVYDNLLSLLRSFNYTCTAYQAFSNVNYRDYLDNDYVLLVRGNQGSAQIGHQWIMDGYRRIVTSIGINGGVNAINYCHYNWGWDGRSNGYFVSDVFDCSQGSEYDNVNWGTSPNRYDTNIQLSAVKYINNN